MTKPAGGITGMLNSFLQPLIASAIRDTLSSPELQPLIDSTIQAAINDALGNPKLESALQPLVVSAVKTAVDESFRQVFSALDGMPNSMLGALQKAEIDGRDIANTVASAIPGPIGTIVNDVFNPGAIANAVVSQLQGILPHLFERYGEGAEKDDKRE